jgi:hypothetical protein
MNAIAGRAARHRLEDRPHPGAPIPRTAFVLIGVEAGGLRGHPPGRPTVAGGNH